MQYILLGRDSEKKKMAMLVQEITRRQNKFWNKVIEYTTFTMAAAMAAFMALDAVFCNSREISR
jgi:hypothetical protein